MFTYSIIIPHYNIPELLVRCLNTIPVREDIQVIVVDDCSPDADTYQERFPEFSRPYLEWYSTPQGGSAGRARNVGLEHAKGKWVLFADSDDFFTEKLESIFEKYEFSTYDIIHFKADSVDTTTYVQSNRHIDRNNGIEAYNDGRFAAKEAALWFQVIWAQMISRRYIEENNIRFEEISFAEDVMFVARLNCLTDNIHISNEVLYVVTTRDEGLHKSAQKDIDHYITYQQICLHYYRYILNHGVNWQKPCMLKIVLQTFRQYGCQGGYKMLKMVIHENALFYGLGEYIKRHV